MFTLQESQMAACSEVSTQSFADEIVRHLVESCPSACEALGGAAVESMVLSGIASATASGNTSKKDVCLYLAVTAALGEGFASRYPWAADILRADNPDSPSQKAAQLWTAAASQTEDAASSAGTDDANASVAQVVALALASKADLAGPLPVGGPVAPCVLPRHTYPMSL
jgi:hypothetical protein